ncbi:MAG: hypothetical protein HXY22_01540 [Alphaproteobacteria bacterium]|nr:hypothetical protein [Alphaproteobacteria bacterium]
MTKEGPNVPLPNTQRPDPREERLAKALRANLRRRKAQDRARAETSQESEEETK